MKLLKRLFVEDEGGEVLEYALVAGLIVILAVSIISNVGNKVLARWTSIKNSI